MNLRAPLSLGGRVHLLGVSVGRDGERVHDCAGCAGRVYGDQWHLTATVRHGDRSREARYHYCDDDCLRSWLAVAAD